MSDVQTDQPTSRDDKVLRSYGVGLGIDAVKADEKTNAAFEEFKAKQAELKAAEATREKVRGERNDMIRSLKDDFNVGFSAIAEVTETSSSNVLYLYERSKGLTAKEIKALSRASNATRAQIRAENPTDAKPSRKQTPAEKAFRKQQRDELRAFMQEERARVEAAGGDTSDLDRGLQGLGDEQAADDAEPAADDA